MNKENARGARCIQSALGLYSHDGKQDSELSWWLLGLVRLTKYVQFLDCGLWLTFSGFAGQLVKLLHPIAEYQLAGRSDPEEN